jgi:hypothetical protein
MSGDSFEQEDGFMAPEERQAREKHSQDKLLRDFTEFMTQNELLAKQNRLFDSYLHRNPYMGGGGRQKHQRKKKIAEALTLYQKYDIAHQELEYRQTQLKSLEAKASDDIGLLKAITEGIRIRINEMRKETYEFKRDIVVGGENQQTGIIMAEKVVRYYEDKLKQKNLLIEKLKLKNNALKLYRQKMDLQVKHKEEQGDSLHSIDFHQLQIKNAQFTKKIHERNADLLKLKMTTGKTVQVLNTTKRRLGDLSHEADKTLELIHDRKTSIVRLQKELERVNVDVKKEKNRNRKFKVQQSNPDMPQVLDYVNQKSSMYDLEAQIRNWKRKNEIIGMAAKRARSTLRKLEGMGLAYDAETDQIVQYMQDDGRGMEQEGDFADTVPMNAGGMHHDQTRQL